jgi:hypothetical protein
VDGKVMNLNHIFPVIHKMSSSKAPSKISVHELRALLSTIARHPDSISFRFRLLGEMWQPNFMQVVNADYSTVNLIDETTKKQFFVPDLRMIVQFELDGQINTFEPYFHYEVGPDQN